MASREEKSEARIRSQRGSLLLVVLALGTVILILGVATLLSTRNAGKVAGLQRLDFQDLHAAEAGVALAQNRLNRAVTLCHGYFSREDSLAVAAALVDTVYALPSAYGSARAVRVRNFRVLPGRPMRVGFEAVGARLKDGVFDTTLGSHVLKASLRMATLGDFAAFVATGIGAAGTGVVNRGRVHANIVQSADDVTYMAEVTYVTAYNFTGSSNPPNTVFMKGPPRQLASNPFTLERVYIDDNAGSDCGAHTYRDLAQGAVADEGSGFFYDGLDPIYIPLGEAQVAGGYARLPYYRYDGNRNPPQGDALGTWSVPSASFNGILYSKRDVYLQGQLTGFSLTLTGGNDVTITGNIACEGNEAYNTDNRVTLGLIAKNLVRYWEKCPTSISVVATFVTPNRNWQVDGNFATHPGRDLAGNPCNKNRSDCWYFRRQGGAICNLGSSVGIYGSYTPRLYEFDPDVLYSPPPKFPALYGTLGPVNLWQVVGLGEEN